MPSGYEYSREFFRRYYTPDNATLFIAGDFDKEPRSRRSGRRTEAGRAGSMRRAFSSSRSNDRAARASRLGQAHAARIWITWHTPAASDLKRAAVQSLLNAYLFGPTSPSTRTGSASSWSIR